MPKMETEINANTGIQKMPARLKIGYKMEIKEKQHLKLMVW